MRSRVPAPWLRAGAFSLASFGLALLAHLVAGGRLPGGPLLAGCFLSVALLTRLVARTERGLVTIVGGVLTVQAGGHLAFAVSAAGRHADLWSAQALLVCHQQPISPALTMGGAGWRLAGARTHPASALWVSSILMLCAHLLAAVMLAFVLRRGERVAWRLAALLRAAFGRLHRLARVEPRQLATPIATLARRSVATGRLWEGALGVRGPPLAAAGR